MGSRNSNSVLHSFHGELQSLCATGELDRAMSLIETSPPSSESSYLCLLKACAKKKALPIARRLQCHFTISHVDLSSSLGEHLVLTLSRCGAFDDALFILHTLPHRTVFTWTAIIASLADCARASEAIFFHHCMLKDGVDPDPYTFVALFKACGCAPDLEYGKFLHDQARSKGFTSDVFVCSALVCMYGKCGAIDDARAAFHEATNHNTVLWTAMSSAFVDRGLAMEALLCYRQMMKEGLHPNQAAFVIAIQACGMIAARVEEKRRLPLSVGMALHANARKQGLASDAFVATTLVSMYGKCGSLSNAQHTFKHLLHPTVPSWNSLMCVYLENGRVEEALQMYVKMLEQGFNPDQQTYVFTLQACGALAERDEREAETFMPMIRTIVRALHVDAHQIGFTSDVFVGTTLLSAYGKCGVVSEAENVFTTLCNRNLITWNAMLSAYTEQGEAGNAREGNFVGTERVFKEWQLAGFKPDKVTFTTLLSACSHAGLVDVGSEYFELMRAYYCLPAEPAHYVCMVDLLGRAGVFSKVENFLRRLRVHDASAVWSSLMGACCTHGNYELGKLIFLRACSVQPEDTATYVLMSNMCSITRSHGEIAERSISELE